jgi:ubiquinone/menaquinone biosynthesis C-methylase UbiE
MKHLSDIKKSFSAHALSYAKSNSLQGKDVLDNFIKLIPTKKTDVVIDIACGPGLVSIPLAKKVKKVVGIDITNETLKVAKKRAHKSKITNIEFKIANACHLQFRDNSFDGAVTRLSLHHMPHPIEVISEMARVVKPGGYIAISDMVCSNNYDNARWHNTIERLRDPSHWMILTNKYLKFLIKEARLKIIKSYLRNIIFDFDEWFYACQRGDESKKLIGNIIQNNKKGVIGFRPKFKGQKISCIEFIFAQIVAKKYAKNKLTK